MQKVQLFINTYLEKMVNKNSKEERERIKNILSHFLKLTPEQQIAEAEEMFGDM